MTAADVVLAAAAASALSLPCAQNCYSTLKNLKIRPFACEISRLNKKYISVIILCVWGCNDPTAKAASSLTFVFTMLGMLALARVGNFFLH